MFIPDGKSLLPKGMERIIHDIKWVTMTYYKKTYRLLPLIAVLACCVNGLSAQSTQKNLKIVFIGNSITYGANLANPRTQAPPVHALLFLGSQAGFGDVSGSNQGHSGFTTVDFLPSETAFITAEKAAKDMAINNTGLLVFSIDLGTNDSAIKGPNGAPLAPKDYHANLKTITDALLKDFPGCIVVIHHPIWYSPNTYNGAMYLQEGLNRLQSYFSEIDGLVADYAKTQPNHVFVGDTKAFDYFKTKYLTDLTPEDGRQGTFYLHPNLKGAVALGTFWGGAIYKIVIGL
jgi:hypothetical protein